MPKKPSCDVSVILNAHNEGRALHPTIKGLRVALDNARKAGLTAEVILVVDRPDTHTKTYVASTLGEVIGEPVQLRILEVDFGDVSSARNYGIRFARGRYVAIFTAGDLFSANILSASVVFLDAHPHAVAHPEYLVSFGKTNEIWRAVDSRDPGFFPESLVEYNPWPICIVSRDIALEVPYATGMIGYGFGPEDWHWNCETLARSYEHYMVPETAYFYRRRYATTLLVNAHTDGRYLLPRTSILRPAGLDTYLSQRVVYVQAKKKSSSVYVEPQPVDMASVAQLPPKHGAVRMAVQGLRNKFYKTHKQPAPVVPSVDNRVPAWLLKEWKRLHEIEHRLFPSETTLRDLNAYVPSSGEFTRLYWSLARLIGPSPDYVFLIPWLKPGGGDLVTLNYITGVLNIRPNARIVVIGAEVTDSPWQERLPAGVTFIALDESFYALEFWRQTRLLGTLFIQNPPKVIHLINSSIGFWTFKAFARQLSQSSRLYVSAFGVDYRSTGQREHYLLDHLEDCIDYVDKVLTDNQYIVDKFVSWQALPSQAFSVQYQPANGSVRKPVRPPKSFSAKRPAKVLWAGRLDRSKHPEVLLDIAIESEKLGLPIEFYVYGSLVTDTEGIHERLGRQTNVTYLGAYDKGLGSLPLHDYDLYLMTTEYEGMPNVLLEATIGGLPIMAPAVGGIPEFIHKNKTGYLIPQYDATQQYIKALESFITHPDTSYDYVIRAQALLAKRHVWHAFTDRLLADGYISKDDMVQSTV